MSEFIRGVQTRFGQQGNFGGIPPEYVAKSYEMTSFGEPESLVDDWMRDKLRDNTCEPPAFESEMPRRWYGSNWFLNELHNGQRSLERPDAPEIYIANTERDPRGCQTMPNFRNYVQGGKDRMRYVDWRSDATSDMSIAEPPKPGPALINATRLIWERLKNFNWFDRSLTAEFPGMAPMRTRGSAQTYFESDTDARHELAEVETTLFTPSEVVLGRGRKPVIIGARHVPTHVFGVARFGSAPRSSVRVYDASKNQWKVEPTARFQKSEERNSRKIARIMAKEAGCRAAQAVPSRSFEQSAEGMADRHVGAHGDVRSALNNGLGTQAVIETVAAEACARAKRSRQDRDQTAVRLHSLVDSDVLSEGTECSPAPIRLLDDPYVRAGRNRNQMTELGPNDSITLPSFSARHLATLEEIRRARGSSWVDVETEDSKMVSRGANIREPTRQEDTIGRMRDIDETEFADSEIGEHLIGPIGDKSRIRAHLRYEPGNGLADINSANRGPFTARSDGSVVSRSLTMSENEPDFAPSERSFPMARTGQTSI